MFYLTTLTVVNDSFHDDVIKWKHFPRYLPFVREIHRSPVNFPHKGQWRGALMFTLICDRINGWVNNREAGDLRRYRVHYDVIVMYADGNCSGIPCPWLQAGVVGGLPRCLKSHCIAKSGPRFNIKMSSYLYRKSHCGDKTVVRSSYCPACRTTLIATRFRVAVICPIIQVPHCIRVFFYFVWFVFINHIFQFYNELCTYCNILDIYLS